LTGVAGKIEPEPETLLTSNISKAGLSFFAPRRIEPGEFIEVEVILLGLGPDRKDIHVSGAGYIVRVESHNKRGWYKLAAEFPEPSAYDEPGWHKLAPKLEKPPL
jgi:hypothetical protein